MLWYEYDSIFAAVIITTFIFTVSHNEVYCIDAQRYLYVLLLIRIDSETCRSGSEQRWILFGTTGRMQMKKEIEDGKVLQLS